MLKHTDFRPQWLVAVVAAIVLLAAMAFSLTGAFPGSVWWLGIGALAASLAMIGALSRMRNAAQDWIRELRSAKSELRSLTHEIEAAERRMQNLADGLDAPVFVCGKDGTIRWANESAKRFFNFEDLVGRTLLEVSLSVDLQQLGAKAAQEDALVRAEIQLSHPQERIVETKAYPAADDPELLFVVANDITELRRLERVRTDFVANASHELRTPMASIRSMAETILQDDELPEETRNRFLSRIIFEVDRLTALSEDLLVLSSAESQKTAVESLDFADVVRYVAQDFIIRAQEKGIEFELDAPETLLLYGDEGQLVQVVQNLMSNAVRYTQQGKICVTLKTEDGEAVLKVTDTGIGIASEHVPRIFERFYRVDRARSRETGGTGLGLSIVKHIVNAHGGTVEVESELNVGSTFTVRLPMQMGDR